MSGGTMARSLDTKNCVNASLPTSSESAERLDVSPVLDPGLLWLETSGLFQVPCWRFLMNQRQTGTGLLPQERVTFQERGVFKSCAVHLDHCREPLARDRASAPFRERSQVMAPRTAVIECRMEKGALHRWQFRHQLCAGQSGQGRHGGASLVCVGPYDPPRAPAEVGRRKKSERSCRTALNFSERHSSKTNQLSTAFVPQRTGERQPCLEQARFLPGIPNCFRMNLPVPPGKSILAEPVPPQNVVKTFVNCRGSLRQVP